MPGNRFRCPECDAPIRLSGSEPAGKRVRCPECDALVRPPAGDGGPRRSGSHGRPRAGAGNGPVIAVVAVVGGLLLAGGAVAGVLYLTAKRQEQPAFNDGGPVAKAKADVRPGAAPKFGGAPKAGGPRVVGLD